MPRKKFKTVDVPAPSPVGALFERIPAPERWRYQWFGDAFTRQDALLSSILEALNVQIDQSNLIIAQNDTIIVLMGGAPPDGVGLPPPTHFGNYLSEDQLENKDQVSEAAPVVIEVLETLGRRARYGFIYSETGTLLVKFNDGSPVPLKAADFLNLADQHLEVEKLRIETASAAAITFRLLLV